MSDAIEHLDHSTSSGSLFVAFELSKMKWNLASATGLVLATWTSQRAALAL